MTPKAIIKEGNPFYPLPADYQTLTTEGQRQARVNGCKQWTLPHLHGQALGEVFADCIELFDSYYLWPEEADHFDPQFYDDAPLPSPYFHRLLHIQSMAWPLATATCPRGSAKTTSIRKEICLHLLARDRTWDVYATSTQDNMLEVGENIKLQFIANRRIIDDFAPEMGGRLMLKRGQGSQATRYFRLANGSRFRGLSIGSKVRGLRPFTFYLDDPESDSKASTLMTDVRKNMHTLIFRMALPAVTKAGARIVWRNTFVSRRHYAFTAMQGHTNSAGQFIADDPLFNEWHRLRVIAEVTHDTPEGPQRRSVWSEMWPLTESDRLLSCETDERYHKVTSLEVLERRMGRAAYLAEMLAAPGESDSSYFGALKETKHGWWFEGPESPTPLQSPNTAINWYRWHPQQEPTQVSMSLQDFRRLARFIVIGDTSNTATEVSDYKACGIFCLTPDNTLLCLELYARKTHEPELAKQMFQMADRWLVPSLHCEAIRQGMSLFQLLQSTIHTRSRELVGVTHLPTVKKINRGMAPKTQFISGLLYRFEQGLIKVPMRKRHLWPWRMLFNQIEDFNPDAENGGLENDDCLDIVAGTIPVFDGRRYEVQRSLVPDKTPLQLLKAGESVDSIGLPLAASVDWRQATCDDVREAIHAQSHRHPEPDCSTVI